MLRILQDRVWRSSTLWLWLMTATLWIAVTVVSAIALWHLRVEALNAERRATLLVSLALTDEVDRGLRGIEEGLLAIGGELRDGHSIATGPAAARALSMRTRLMPLVRTLWLLDGDGRLLLTSAPLPAPDLTSFWPPLAGLPDDVIAISRPFTDVNTKESLVALAMRVGGSKDGGDRSSTWVVAGVLATDLLGAFPAASPGDDARMAVFRDDGVRLVGRIVDRTVLDEAAMAKVLAIRPSIELHRFRDGSERLISLHSLPRYGLKLMLTRDMDTALGAWTDTAQLALAGILVLLVVLVVSVRRVIKADRRQAAAQLALEVQQSRAGKLESLGKLAGSVAHDFNNVLAAILGFGEMAQGAAPPASNQARHLDKVLQAALRGKALVERILTFSRGGAQTMTVFELEPVVGEVLALLSASLPTGVRVERRLEAPGARLRGDPTQVYEAGLNLCTNAIQAMADTGGSMRVELVRARVGRPQVLSHSQLTAGDYLVLSVADQGAGIGPADMDHLFEPFFTTRGATGGTGLGLAVVHGVIAELDGAIDVQSTPGRGSRFALYFRECTDVAATFARVPKVAPTGAGQRLLVVDDDPVLLALGEEMLRALGYEPHGFTDSVAALSALQEDPEQFAAVITDEVMPGFSGTQLTAALRKVAPRLPVLLISGYGGTSLAARAATAGVTRVLTKPVPRAELARALAELLRQGDSAAFE